MPKVTEAYRESRRDEIAHAAVRCLARHGFAGTSMADIIAESGMSAGSIYSHFGSKADIAMHVARIVITERGDALAAHIAASAAPISPIEIMLFTVDALERNGVPKSVLVQIWAEATVDRELHDLVLETVGGLSEAYRAAVRPWLEARSATVTDEDVALAATTMITLSQGYLTHSALFGGGDPQSYLASAGMLLG